MFYPIIIFLLFRSWRLSEKRFSYISLTLLSILVCASVHRMIIYFFAFIVIPFIISTAIFRIYPKFGFYSKSKFLSFSLLFLSILVLVLASFGITISDFSYIIENRIYAVGLSDERGPVYLLMNLALFYSTWLSISIVCIPLGIIYLVQKSIINHKYLFLVFAHSLSDEIRR